MGVILKTIFLEPGHEAARLKFNAILDNFGLWSRILSK